MNNEQARPAGASRTGNDERRSEESARHSKFDVPRPNDLPCGLVRYSTCHPVSKNELVKLLPVSFL